MYHGNRVYDFKRCDECGAPLTERQWLYGLCKRCEEAVRTPKLARGQKPNHWGFGPKQRPVETLKATKGVL